MMIIAGLQKVVEMKKFLLIRLLAVVLSTAAVAGNNQYTLGVDGLACPFCAYGIEKKLSAIEGVESIETDVKSGQVVVTVAAGKTLSEEAARQAVEDAGFTLRSFHKATPGQ